MYTITTGFGDSPAGSNIGTGPYRFASSFGTVGAVKYTIPAISLAQPCGKAPAAVEGDCQLPLEQMLAELKASA